MNREDFEKASKVMAELNDAKKCLEILKVWDKYSKYSLILQNFSVAVCEENVPSEIDMPKELTPVVLNILRERTEDRIKKLQNNFEKI